MSFVCAGELGQKGLWWYRGHRSPVSPLSVTRTSSVTACCRLLQQCSTPLLRRGTGGRPPLRADGDVGSGGRPSDRLIKTIKTTRDRRDRRPDSHVSRDCLLKGFPRRTLWCQPPWRIWFSLCPIRPNFFFGRRCAAGRRSAPRARPESWPAVGGLASSVHAHRLALAQASGQELRAWDSAMRQSAP